jgi:hypothetical protein
MALINLILRVLGLPGSEMQEDGGPTPPPKP